MGEPNGVQRRRSILLLDWIIAPAIIFAILYNSNFSNGRLLPPEAGQYLAAVSAIYHGNVAYRDFFVVYGPLSAYVPALIMSLFGATLETLRGYFHITTIITVIISYFLAMRVLRTRAFLYVATFSLMVETFNPFWSTRWSAFRGGMGLLVLWLLFASMDRDKRGRWLLPAGFVTAIALLFSTEIGLLAGFASLVFFAAEARVEDGDRRRSPCYFLPYVYGIALCLVPFSLYFLYENALYEYLRVTFFDIPFNHIAKFSQGSIPSIFPQSWGLVEIYRWALGGDLKIWMPAIIFAIAATHLVRKSLKRERWTERHVMLAVLIAYGLPLYMVSFRAVWGPQFTASIAPAILIGMMYLESIWLHRNQSVRGAQDSKMSFVGHTRSVLSGFVILVSLCYVVFSANSFGSTSEFIRYAIGIGWGRGAKDISKLDIEGGGNVWLPSGQTAEITGVTNYIKAKTSPGEPIFGFPETGIYYFFTDRPNVTRFSIAALAGMTSRYGKEVLAAIKANPPRYIIYDPRQSDIAAPIGEKTEDLLPGVIEYVVKEYHVEEKVGVVLILRHN
ncbi:MAG: hypothetical protein ACLP5H_31870 [Desulfomonilaceae bacterium]